MKNEAILTDEDRKSMPSMPTVRGGGTSRPGDPVLGRIDQYDLIGKLGGGGFGVVYLARDTVSGTEFALKTLHPLLLRDAEQLEALRGQFALVSRLSHPNIASALVLHRCRDVRLLDEDASRDLRLEAGDSVMVMRYAPGVTLSKWRKAFDGGIVPVAQTLEIGRQVASALDYAHSERIVHRDVKPGNIMVETLNGGGVRARVLDFGLAAEIRSSMARLSSGKCDTSGTRPYMSPEQWRGGRQDGRSDQYALACALYELLSGEPPFSSVFETGDPEIMMVAVERRTPDPVPGVPAAANAALLRALAKDPAARFPSCSAFVGALETALGGSGGPSFQPGRLAAAALAVWAGVRKNAALSASRFFAFLSGIFKIAKRHLSLAFARCKRRTGAFQGGGGTPSASIRRRRARMWIAIAVAVAVAGVFAYSRMSVGNDEDNVAAAPEPETGILDALGTLVDVGVRAYVDSSYENETKCRNCGGSGMVHVPSVFGSVIHVPCRACNGTGRTPQLRW